MRTIKFRGRKIQQRFDNKLNKAVNDWLIGNLHVDVKDCAIYDLHNVNDGYFVDCKTIGQFTGLHDKNGKEIYEGDKLVITQSFQVLDGEVIYHEDTACYRLKIDEDEQEVLWYLPKEMEIIGNIHEEELKMITNEEVKKELGDKVIFSTIPITINYLKQQAKVEELLGLYRKYYGHIPYSYNPRIKYYEQKIDQLEDKLEKELEELK